MSLALSSSQTPSFHSRPAAARPARQVANPQGSTRAAGPDAACVNSTDLLRGQKAVEINHNGFVYRLQATRLGKLILTK